MQSELQDLLKTPHDERTAEQHQRFDYIHGRQNGLNETEAQFYSKHIKNPEGRSEEDQVDIEELIRKMGESRKSRGLE